MQKGSTNWRIKFFSDPKLLNHSDYMGLPLKIENHSKKRMFKAVSSFSYTKQYGCFNKSTCIISITEISDWKGMNMMFWLKETC